MIVRIKKMGTRSTNTDAGVDSKQKQTHTHTRARADLYESCIQVASKEGWISSVGQQKIVTFNEFYI